nr:DUF1016 N-terminal domain-containing protein [Comamonas sp.]
MTQAKADPKLQPLLTELAELIRQARQQAVRAVDTIQVQTCWEIGWHIVEFEQGGQARAAYGKKLLPTLASELTAEFGKGSMPLTCATCVCSTKLFRFVTHCVTN